MKNILLCLAVFIGAKFQTEGVTKISCDNALKSCLQCAKHDTAKFYFYLKYSLLNDKVYIGSDRVCLAKMDDIEQHMAIACDFIDAARSQNKNFSQLFGDLLTKKRIDVDSDEAERLRAILFRILEAVEATHGFFISNASASLQGEQCLEIEAMQPTVSAVNDKGYQYYVLPMFVKRNQNLYMAEAVRFFANKRREVCCVTPYFHENDHHWLTVAFYIKWSEDEKKYNIKCRILDSLDGTNVDFSDVFKSLGESYKCDYKYIPQKTADGKNIQQDRQYSASHHNCGIFAILNTMLLYKLLRRSDGSHNFNGAIEILQKCAYSEIGLDQGYMRQVFDELFRIIDTSKDKAKLEELREAVLNAKTYQENFTQLRLFFVEYLRLIAS
jgi:hypothetical protein